MSAKVIVPDGATDRVRLYQRLLELNASAIKGAAFALQDGAVLLIAERSTVGVWDM